MLQTFAFPSSECSLDTTVKEDDTAQNRNEKGDLLVQSMSYLQKILLGNEQLRFERFRYKDDDNWIGSSAAYSSYLSRQRPLLPYSKPTTSNRDDVLTGLSIDPSQQPASPAIGRGTSASYAYSSPRAAQSPMAAKSGYLAACNSPRPPQSPLTRPDNRPRTSCWTLNPGQFSPARHFLARSTVPRDTVSSPHPANSPPVRCARAVRASSSARRLHMPLRPAPSPACLTPTGDRAFQDNTNADIDGDTAV
jgi:hypothetical protein